MLREHDPNRFPPQVFSDFLARRLEALACGSSSYAPPPPRNTFPLFTMRTTATLLLACLATASAFSPATRTARWTTRPTVSQPVRMSEESSEIIPVTEESIKASSAVVGGIAGFAIGAYVRLW